MVSTKYDFLGRELREIEARGLLRRPKLVSGPIGPRVTIEGREVLLLCSNDYLGLASHPEVKRAAAEAVNSYGTGAGASRLVCGALPVHAELEAALAELKETEAAVVFGSGYLANIGAISAVMGGGGVIFSDELNHASIIDGCRLSRASVRVYPHRNMSALKTMLSGNEIDGKKLIVTDGVFSMDGDIAPLAELAQIASEFDCCLMVDDAHATGVLGPGGKGTASHFCIGAGLDIQMGTLSKALGSYGAFVAGSRDLIDFLLNSARSLIFTTALPPPSAAAALAALKIIAREPERRERLWSNASLLKRELQSAGLEVGATETVIIPVMVGEPKECVTMAETLLDEGVFAQAIRPPSVPEGSSRLRVVPSAEHTEADLEEAIDAFVRAGKKSGIL